MRDESIGGLILFLIVAGFLFLLFFTKVGWSEQVVSGVVYNTKNNKTFTGNTTFSVRASEDTFVSEENRSSFCLPPNSQYKELVTRAAKDKSIRVTVTTSKFFKVVAPWTCVDNVTVEENE